MDAEGLPLDFVALLREERERVLPCVGAGLSIPAGIRDLAADVAQAGAVGGLDVGDRDLTAVVAALEAKHGVEATQRLVADTVKATPVLPTLVHKALALCPLRIVATFNYDNCLELAAEAVGRTARPVLPNTVDAFRHPAADDLVVLHLHGAASDASSIVLPGATTEQLAERELFRHLLTSLWAQYVVVYFGFSFAPTEVHLFAALGWFARELPDADEQRLLLPAPEAEQRADELAPLVANPLFDVVPYPHTTDHRAVHQAALLIAPRNDPAPDTVESLAPEPKEHYEAPALLEVAPGADPAAVEAEAIRAGWGLGASWVTIPELFDAGRAVVVAPPGMGKTQLVRAAGRASDAARKPLLMTLKELPGLLDGEESPLRAFARLVVGARAFDSSTPVPTRDRLDSGSYLFLLDALDEVPPGRQAETINALARAVDRWPQHGYVVTTRPTVEASALIEKGFRSFRIVQSSDWGARYFERRGIPRERLDDLRGRAPTAFNLVGIPTYAASIGEQLIDGIDVSDRPIDLLLYPVRKLAQVEAEKQGKPTKAFLGWLQRLAVGLELRGRNQASTEELGKLSGPEGEDSPRARERLVQAALLVDVPDLVQFPERTVQEALCAEALLACDDIVAVVREVAVGDLDGEETLRGDIDHCLDQVWANATVQQRAALRAVDGYRWARTIRSDCDETEAEQGLDVIWNWHRERRVWMNWAAQGQLRGAQEAITLIAESHPDAIRKRRDELIAATQSEEPTGRSNAMEVLSAVGTDEDTGSWLVPLLRDDSEVVRRHAAEAVARLGVSEALTVLQQMLPSRGERSEADAFARALVKLTPDEELGVAARALRQNGQVWTSVADELAGRLTLDDALALLIEGVPDHLGLLNATLERHPPESWSAAEVERLAQGLVRNDVQVHEDVRADLLGAVVAIHPESALRGIRQGAELAEVHWTNLFFAEALDDEFLNGELDGPLAEPYRTLLELKAARRVPRGAPDAAAPGARRNSRSAHAPSALGRQLDDGEIREDRVPEWPVAWRAEDLTAAQRDRLTELVEAWWPGRALRELIVGTDSGGHANPFALAAVCAGAALDLDLSDDRWLDLLGTSAALSIRPDIVGWLRRQHRPALDERAAEVIRASSDDWHVYHAVGAFAELSEPVARAFIDRMPVVRDPLRFAAVAQTLITAGHQKLLADVDLTQLDEAQRQSLLEAQAGGGDVEAQLTLVNQTLERQRVGQPSPPLRFAHAVTDELLVEPLAELLGLLGQSGGARDDLQRSAIQALAHTQSVAALRAYDRLMDDGSFASAFFWYPREELARAMAREQVLGRLPDLVADVPTVVEAHGWRPGETSLDAPDGAAVDRAS